MESFIAPLSQELVNAERISPQTIARLNALLTQAPLSDRVASVKIWRPGGLVAFKFGIGAEGKALEDIAPPLSTYDENGNQLTKLPV